MGDDDLRARVGELIRTARGEAGMTQRALARAASTSQSAVARYEGGAVLPDLRTLTRLVNACGRELTIDTPHSRSRRGRSGAETAAVRPVAVPDDLDDPSIRKVSGVVQLPRRIRWSGPPRTYDLSKRRDRARVYEQVLREGTDDDVRRYVRLDELVDMWDDLVLPTHVRAAWNRRIARHRRERRC